MVALLFAATLVPDPGGKDAWLLVSMAYAKGGDSGGDGDDGGGGNSGSGNSGSGSSGSGNSGSGSSGSGNSGSGNSGSDDSGSDDSGRGRSGSGDIGRESSTGGSSGNTLNEAGQGRGGPDVVIHHVNGWIEGIFSGTYVVLDAKKRTVIRRSATPSDFKNMNSRADR